MKVRALRLLLVEDSDDDVELTAAAFREDKIVNEFDRVRHGAEALAYLHHEPPFEHAPRPNLIMLDLDMPVMDGYEFMRRVKREPALRDIPVVVFTASEAEREHAKQLDLGAISYAAKPMNFKEFCRLVRTISYYAFAVVETQSSTA
jgi:CheY-like chemotaxis protein